MARYDVIIIGGGPAGYSAAIRAAQLGMAVACVEKRLTLGGTCLNVGCIPSKALLHASEMFERASTGFARLGIRVDPVLDLEQMHRQKADSVEQLTKGIDFLFRKNGIHRIAGYARVDGVGRVRVSAADGIERSVEAGNIVIATGSEPSQLPGLAIDGERSVDSTGALSLPRVPKRLSVVGAGIIGLELGSVWRRLGAEVEMVEHADRIVTGADGEVAAVLQRLLGRQGLAFRLGTRVAGAVRTKAGVALSVEAVNGGGADTVEAEVVLVAVGRRPSARDLGLENVGLAANARGFLDTERFSTAVPGLWAVGDVIGGAMLAHKAEEEAVACIERIAGLPGEVNYEAIPSVIYTAPEVAWVGSTEEELKRKGVGYRVGRFPFAANSRARVAHEAEGFAKVLADAGTERILGVHVVGPQAGEMIAGSCVAMEFGGEAEDIARTSHPHPTRSEALRQAAMGVRNWTMQS